jgi:hypothetical protein
MLAPGTRAEAHVLHSRRIRKSTERRGYCAILNTKRPASATYDGSHTMRAPSVPEGATDASRVQDWPLFDEV